MSLKTSLSKDLEVFFNLDDFAEEVDYRLGSNTTKVVVQFFDEESDLGNSIFRKMIVRVEDLPSLSKEGYFAINGEDYKVLDFIPDEQNLIFNVVTRRADDE